MLILLLFLHHLVTYHPSRRLVQQIMDEIQHQIRMRPRASRIYVRRPLLLHRRLAAYHQFQIQQIMDVTRCQINRRGRRRLYLGHHRHLRHYLAKTHPARQGQQRRSIFLKRQASWAPELELELDHCLGSGLCLSPKLRQVLQSPCHCLADQFRRRPNHRTFLGRVYCSGYLTRQTRQAPGQQDHSSRLDHIAPFLLSRKLLANVKLEILLHHQPISRFHRVQQALLVRVLIMRVRRLLQFLGTIIQDLRHPTLELTGRQHWEADHSPFGRCLSSLREHLLPLALS